MLHNSRVPGKNDSATSPNRNVAWNILFMGRRSQPEKIDRHPT
jgi:hypothetical protein